MTIYFFQYWTLRGNVFNMEGQVTSRHSVHWMEHCR